MTTDRSPFRHRRSRRPGCAPRWPRPRSATTSSATRRSTASRSASPNCWARKPGALVPDRHDGQPGRPADADLAGRRRHRLPREPRGLARDRRQRRERRRPADRDRTGGSFPRAEFEAAVKPEGPPHLPADDARRGREHPQPRRGRCRPQADAEAVANAARERGSRRTSTAPDSGTRRSSSESSVAELSARFDVVMVSLSKGLGAPGGSVVAASRDRIPALVRYRRMSGGAMRQVGIFAAAGLWALDRNVERLAEDHASARAIAARLAESQAYVIDPATVDTNILVWQVADGAPDDRGARSRTRRSDLCALAADVLGGDPSRHNGRTMRDRRRDPRGRSERIGRRRARPGRWPQ